MSREFVKFCKNRQCVIAGSFFEKKMSGQKSRGHYGIFMLEMSLSSGDERLVGAGNYILFETVRER